MQKRRRSPRPGDDRYVQEYPSSEARSRGIAFLGSLPALLEKISSRMQLQTIEGLVHFNPGTHHLRPHFFDDIALLIDR